MAKHWVFAVVGVVLLATSIAAFVVGSIPSYSTTSSYLTFSELNVDVVVDPGHVYQNSISAQAEDKFVFNLTMTDGRVNSTLWLGSDVVYQEIQVDRIETDFQAPSNGIYGFTVSAPETVAVDGTVSVLRLTTTATETALYLGVGLIMIILSFLFIVYSVYLHLETEKGQIIEPALQRD